MSETRDVVAGSVRKHKKNKAKKKRPMDPGLRRDDEVSDAYAGMTKSERPLPG